MFCEQPGGVDSFFPRVCFYVNQALARPPPRLCAGICTYLSSSSSMYLLLCVCVQQCMYTTIMYVCVCVTVYVLYTTMYVYMYVCVLYTTTMYVCVCVCVCVCVAHSLSSACASTYQLLCGVCMYTTVGVLLCYTLLYACILLSVQVYIITVCVCVHHYKCMCMYRVLCAYYTMYVYVQGTAVLVCIHALLCVCLLLYVHVLYTVVYACMYTVCVYVCIAHSVRAPLLLPCLCSVCVGMLVLVYCMSVVGMVVVMGSPCRTYVVRGAVYVSTVALGCVYYSRCVLRLMIVRTKEQVCMCPCTQQYVQGCMCVQYSYKCYSRCCSMSLYLLLLLSLLLLIVILCSVDLQDCARLVAGPVSRGWLCVRVQCSVWCGLQTLCICSDKNRGVYYGKIFFLDE